jgi:hypothetical protein
MNHQDENNELKSVIKQLQGYEENLPESVKEPQKRNEVADIARKQLREIQAISKNIRIITVIVVISIVIELIAALTNLR